MPDAVAVANAALAEVGLPQSAYRDEHLGRSWITTAGPSSLLNYRALVLGWIAQHGAERRTLCFAHAHAGETHNCTQLPAIIALRGGRCDGRDA